MKEVNIAIVGATGAVGEVMLELLAERDFPAKSVSLLASERSAGARIPFKQQSITVQNLAEFDFTGTDIALFFRWRRCFCGVWTKSCESRVCCYRQYVSL